MMSMIANLLPRVTLYSENVPRRTEIQPFKLVVLIKYILYDDMKFEIDPF